MFFYPTDAVYLSSRANYQPMMRNPIPHLFPLLLLFMATVASATPSKLLRGFEAAPDSAAAATLQPLLVDPTGNFSLCFLRVETSHLSLAVVHLHSQEPLWTAALSRPAPWDKRTRLTFNGSIVISDPDSRVLWSTQTNTGNDVVLSSSSNLQVLSDLGSPLWQSFDFPSDTIVDGQNFTSSMTLVSSNNLYTLRLGADFFGLYAKFDSDKDQIYYKHSALQVKATIVKGQGPIYIRVSPDGYLGMYQTGTQPTDIQPFNSYQRSVPGIRRLRIEPDGNLKSYYWSGSGPGWVVDYEAIAETCELPDPCGPYGLCQAGNGCSCLDNRTDAGPGKCYSGRESGGLCGGGEFGVVRRVGVELPYKELMGFIETASLEGCEAECESNCSCRGAVYSNSSGYCYMMDYPAQTLLAVGDGGKAGYFKVREGAGSGKRGAGWGLGVGVLIGAVVLVAVGFVAWRRKVGGGMYLKQERMVDPGPYKDLGEESFGSVELGRR